MSARLRLPLWCLALLVPAVASAQQAETIEYYGTDAIGSIRIVWDVNGNVLGRQDYAPFGKALFPVPAMPKEGFVGNEQDAETDQGNFHARMFAAQTGRFNAIDPVSVGALEPQRWNRYAYALNNPLRYTDATGTNADPCATTTYCENVNAPYDYVEMSDVLAFLMGWSGGGGGGSGSGDSGGGTGGGTNTPKGGTTSTDDSTLSAEPDVTNTGNNTIFVKQEDDKDRDNIIPVKPGQTWVGRSDGIADPCGHPGQVFKNVDFTDVFFSPTLTVATPSPWFFVVPPTPAALEGAQLVKGGWKGADFNQAHHDWDALYRAANSQPTDCK